MDEKEVITKKHAHRGSFIDWLHTCVTTDACRHSRTTTARYHALIDTYMLPFFGDIPLDRIDEDFVQRFYNGLGEEGRGLAPQTIHLIHSVLNGGMKQAVGHGLLRYNPCDLAYFQRRLYGSNAILSADGMRAILKQEYAGEYENLFPILLLGALSFGEAAAISWEDVDFEQNRLHIRKRLLTYNEGGHTRYQITPLTGTRPPRLLCLPPLAMLFFYQERKRQQKHRKSAGDGWENPYHLVFTTREGKALPYYKVQRRFKKLVCQLGQPYANLHSLRHTGASVCFHVTGSIASVQALTGVSSLSMAGTFVHALDLSERGDRNAT